NVAAPGVGLLPMNAQLREIMSTSTALEIMQQNEEELLRVGIDEPVRKKFLENCYFTTTQRMAMVFYLRKLLGVEHLTSMGGGASDWQSDADALAAIQEVQLLADLRRSRPFSRMIFVGMPLVPMNSGELALVCTADYLVDNPPLVQLVGAIRSQNPSTP